MILRSPLEHSTKTMTCIIPEKHIVRIGATNQSKPIQVRKETIHIKLSRESRFLAGLYNKNMGYLT